MMNRPYAALAVYVFSNAFTRAVSVRFTGVAITSFSPSLTTAPLMKSTSVSRPLLRTPYGHAAACPYILSRYSPFHFLQKPVRIGLPFQDDFGGLRGFIQLGVQNVPDYRVQAAGHRHG